MLNTIVSNPYLNITAGLVLLLTAGYEIIDVAEVVTVGSHHGVFVFALIHIMKSIPEITHGLDSLEKAEEEIKK
ncbi:hypothetical protein JYT78_00135 [bacterium AH-315-I20]|nr:hypothetical protein [bacterium AH-315-I20]